MWIGFNRLRIRNRSLAHVIAIMNVPVPEKDRNYLAS
jgi:hypothetical protein